MSSRRHAGKGPPRISKRATCLGWPVNGRGWLGVNSMISVERRPRALAAAGANAFLLRDVLGHKTIQMSSRYVQASSDSLLAATEQAAAIAMESMNPKA